MSGNDDFRRDRELDILLAPLQELEKNDLDSARWNKAVKQEIARADLKKKRLKARSNQLLWLIAALFLGYILGVASGSFYHLNKSENLEKQMTEKKIQPGSTISTVYVNID